MQKLCMLSIEEQKYGLDLNINNIKIPISHISKPLKAMSPPLFMNVFAQWHTLSIFFHARIVRKYNLASF